LNIVAPLGEKGFRRQGDGIPTEGFDFRRGTGTGTPIKKLVEGDVGALPIFGGEFRESSDVCKDSKGVPRK